METIWKFELEVTDEQSIEMPYGAEILSVQWQRDKLCVWAMVSPTTLSKSNRSFVIFGTGHSIPDNLNAQFLGTVQDNFGLVWHVFEGSLL